MKYTYKIVGHTFGYVDNTVYVGVVDATTPKQAMIAALAAEFTDSVSSLTHGDWIDATILDDNLAVVGTDDMNMELVAEEHTYTIQVTPTNHNQPRETMSSKRYQTTFTFKSKGNADKFIGWLTKNTNDRDYGYPFYVNALAVSDAEWCVEYSTENDFVRGVATGIDL